MSVRASTRVGAAPSPIVSRVAACYRRADFVDEVITSMDTPQFQKAEYGGAASQAACAICRQPVGAAYYRVNGAMACEQCAARVKNATPESSHANFMRGLFFGIGGAIAGLVLYAGFTIVTKIYLGYISVAVGYIVGKAIKMGSKGFGGRRYQILAVLLTYASMSIAEVPIALSHVASWRELISGPGQLLYLIGSGLASPFTNLAHSQFHGAIEIVILLIGMRIAWQITSMSDHAQIAGPFKNEGAAAPAAPPPSLG